MTESPDIALLQALDAGLDRCLAAVDKLVVCDYNADEGGCHRGDVIGPSAVLTIGYVRSDGGEPEDLRLVVDGEALDRPIEGHPELRGDVSGPPPGTDPPGEPEPAEADSVAARAAVRRWLKLPAAEREKLRTWLVNPTPAPSERAIILAADALHALPVLAAHLAQYEELQRDGIRRHSRTIAVLEAAVAWYNVPGHGLSRCTCEACKELVGAVAEYTGGDRG